MLGMRAHGAGPRSAAPYGWSRSPDTARSSPAPSVAIEDAIVELMQRAKIEAIKRQTSFEALVAEGLRAMLARQKEEA